MTDIDAANAAVILARRPDLPYDYLIVATGATHSLLRQRPVGGAGARAQDDRERHRDPQPRAAGLRAGRARDRSGEAARLAELRHRGRRSDRAWNWRARWARSPTTRCGTISATSIPREAQILLVEGEPRVLPGFPPDLSAKAEQQLIALGVRTRTSARVTEIDADGVTVKSGRQDERIATHTVLWAAGVRANTLGKVLGERAGAPLDQAGRVMVEPDLSIAGPSGDLRHRRPGQFHCIRAAKPLPGVAPVAMQQGRYVAKLIRAGESTAARAASRSTISTRATWRPSAATRRWPISA